MIDSILDKKTVKRFDSIAKEKAKISKKETDAVKTFYQKARKETIDQLFHVVESRGHPNEKKLSRDLKEKYYNEKLEFDDIMSLDALYKSNFKHFKDEKHAK